MRFLSLLVCLAALLAAPCALAEDVAAASSNGRMRMVKRASTGGKGLSASAGKVARAYDKYRNKFSWSYGWGDETHSDKTPNDQMLRGVQFYPMVKKGQSYGDWDRKASKAIRAGSKYILGANEPNLSQSPKKAAQEWKKNIEPLLRKYRSRGLRAVSPALAFDGIDWYKQFLKNCKGCHISAVALHIYGRNRGHNGNVARLRDYIKRFERAFPGRKIWFTEFQSPRGSSVTKAINFMRAATKIFRKDSRVMNFTAYPNRKGLEFVRNGKLTRIGKAWAQM